MVMPGGFAHESGELLRRKYDARSAERHDAGMETELYVYAHHGWIFFRWK